MPRSCIGLTPADDLDEILAEIDERGLSRGPWPLKVGIGLHVGSAVTGNVCLSRIEKSRFLTD